MHMMWVQYLAYCKHWAKLRIQIIWPKIPPDVSTLCDCFFS
jgi:hypothetical protein